MLAVAVNGSPRKGGNTALLLDAALAPLKAAGWETEHLSLRGTGIKGCQACYRCAELQNGRCVFDNDGFNDIMQRLIAADAILLGSPTYFTDVTAEMKALLDRAGLVAIRNGRLFRGKIGAAVVAVRRGGGVHVFDTINHMFLMSQMIVPGASYWNLGYGRDPGEAGDDAEGLTNMRVLGETIDWLGRAMQPHRDSFPTV